MLMIHTIVACLSACAAAQPPAAANAIAFEWHRLQLPCGVRVIIIHAPNAQRQTTFSFLPVHLGNDDADHAQWSHLLEHMLIRTTDAEGLQADGITINGETTATYLRLETIAAPDKWMQAFDRHARWLQVRTFDAARLEREKRMIAREEEGTAATGMTGKFAIAAWNQIITHGRPAAHVHGDVQSAKIEEVEAHVAARVHLDASALIATIGPRPIQEVQAEIERLFADPPVAPPSPDAWLNAAADEARVTQATWDLPTRHVLWWWPLPDDRPQTQAAATGVARSLLMRVRSHRDFTMNIRQALVHPAITTQRGTFMILDACLAPNTNPEHLSKIVRECAAALCDRTLVASQQSIVFAARMAAQELNDSPDLAAMAKPLPESMRPAVEGLWLLSQLNYEFTWGAPATDARQMLMQLDEASVAEVLNRLRAEPRELILEPEPAAQR